MSGYNTNLAAEFYVLSVLHRLGAEANLTLGNKKSADIAIVRSAGDAITVDVKGLAGKTGWPVDNVRAGTPNHFIAFVCYLGKIDDPDVLPGVYIVPPLVGEGAREHDVGTFFAPVKPRPLVARRGRGDRAGTGFKCERRTLNVELRMTERYYNDARVFLPFDVRRSAFIARRSFSL